MRRAFDAYGRRCLFVCGALPPTAALTAVCLSLAGPALPIPDASPPAPAKNGWGSRFSPGINPDTVSLGRVPRGATVESSLTVFNPLSESLHIKRVETSCPCLTVGAGPMRIASGERVFLPVRYDSSEEPDFLGRLSVDVTGVDAEGQIAFRARVQLEVAPDAAAQPERRTPRAGTNRRSGTP
jgi:Protein of unknown function (DUF1573)